MANIEISVRIKLLDIWGDKSLKKVVFYLYSFVRIKSTV